MSRTHYGPIDQIGLVVDDLDASIARWSRLAGLGPWTVFRNVSLNGTYRGQEGIVTMDVAMAYQDHTQIEMIAPTNDTPSPYRGEDGKLILGMHHVAWLIDDLDQECARAVANGLDLVFKAENESVRVAYFEAKDEPGIMFEFIESEQTRQLMEHGRAAARDWDGTNPVQEIDILQA